MPEDKELKDAIHNEHQIKLPKKDKSKTAWIVVSIILLLALIGIGAYGYMQITKLNKSNKDKDATISDLQNKKKTLESAAAAAATAVTQAVTTSATDQEKIIVALRAQCAESYQPESPKVGPDLGSYNIKTINNGYAQASYLCSNAPEGPEAILVKQKDNWVVVAQGIGDIVSTAVRNLYSIPASFK